MELIREDDWRKTLGYLPVPLNGQESERRFVMLNGAQGNFCLDVNDQDTEPKQRRDVAWSVDVDHYVRVMGGKVEVTRWDQTEVLRSSAADVVNNLDAFQNYLQTAKAPRDRSVVAHALSIYHRIRSMLPDESAGLEAFLYMLYQASTGTHAVDDAELHWQDLQRCEEAWLRISSQGRDRVQSDLLAPRSEDKRPSIPLVIRHAMGRIFQEAHNLVMVSPQMSLLEESDLIVMGKASRFSGAYFTPTPLVRTLVEQCITPEVLARPELTILDPACGSGEFLRECVRQLTLHHYTGRLHIEGYDVSLPAVLMARFALANETRGIANPTEVSIKHCDALATDWPANVDICLMNPPYASWRSLPIEARKVLESALKDLAGARPDLAFAFLLKGAECLSPGGLLGAVVPASMLDGDSAEPLRSRLDRITDKRVLVRLGNQSIFAEATVDVCLYVSSRPAVQESQRAESQEGALMIWADHSPDSSDRALRTLRSLDWQPAIGDIEIERAGYSIYTSPSVSLQSWAPRPLSSVRLLRRLAKLPSHDKIYDISQGTITGLNDAFLLPETEFRQLPKKERAFFRKAVVNASIRNGRLFDGHWVFYPYGDDCEPIATEEELHRRVPRYMESHLVPHKAALIRRAGIDKATWWQLTRKRDAFSRKTPKIVTTYFGDAGSIAWDEIGEFVVVQGYSWEPLSTSMATAEVGRAVVAIMASGVASKLIAAVSNNLAGGQFNLSKRFISKMPFVDMGDERLGEQVKSLAVLGEAIGRGDRVDELLLDRLVEDLFLIASDLKG
jgi:adenine-specific DNA-methyltransferase